MITDMDAISPKLSATEVDPIDARISPQTNAVGPPLSRPAPSVMPIPSQVERTVRPKATSGFKEIYLYNGWLEVVIKWSWIDMNQAAVTYIQLSVVIAPRPLVLSGAFRLPITVIAAIVDGHPNVPIVGHGGGDSGRSKEAAIVKKGSVDRTELLGNGS